MTSPLRRQFGMLRRAPSFRLLFIAGLESGLGTWMATVALTVEVTDKTHSPWWVSALFVVTFLPSVVVGLAAGPLIDRLSRKHLVVAADLVRLGVFCALPFAGRATEVIALAGIAGVANSFFRPAVLAGVPNLVAEDELAHGTSLLQAADWAATTIGPVLGGVLVSLSGPHLVYWIDAATFLVSALLILRIPGRLLQSEQALTQGHWRDVVEGVATFRRSIPLVTALVAFGFAMLASGLVNVSEIFLAERSLHRGAFGYGLLWTATGLGLVIGSVVGGSLVERRSILMIYPLAFLPWAAGIFGAAVSPSIWVAAISMVLAGFGNGVAFPMTVLIVQRYTPDRVRGRVFTVIISAHNALLGVALVAAGALTDSLGPRWTYGFSAGLLVLGSLTAFAFLRASPVEAAVPGSAPA